MEGRIEGANRVETRKSEGKTPEQERLLRRCRPVVRHFELTVPKAGELAGGREDGMPQEAVGVQPLSFSGREFDERENEFIVQQPDQPAGPPGHRRMDHVPRVEVPQDGSGMPHSQRPRHASSVAEADRRQAPKAGG